MTPSTTWPRWTLRVGNQVVHEAEEEGMKLLLLVEAVEEKREVEQEEKIMF